MKARLTLIYEKEIKKEDREWLEEITADVFIYKDKNGLQALEEAFNIDYDMPVDIKISFIVPCPKK